jgi:TctA family transporter
MLLGFILGPMMEEFFRRALIIERGDFRVFIERPISAGLLAVALLLLMSMSLPAIARWRQRAVAEPGKA